MFENILTWLRPKRSTSSLFKTPTRRWATCTIIVIPDETASPSRFTVPRMTLLCAACLVFCLGGAATALVVDYMRINAIVRDYERIKAENHSIRSEAAALVHRLGEIQASLNQVDSFSNQLREMAKPEGMAGKKTSQKNRVRPLPSAQKGINTTLLQDHPLSIPRGIGPLSKEDYLLSKKAAAAGNVFDSSINFDKLEFKETFERLLDIGHKSKSQAHELEHLLQDVRDYQKRISSTPTLAPTSGYLTSTFGYRVSPFTGKSQMHWGLDIAAPTGSPVRAAAGGRVVAARWSPDYGNHIDVDHGHGILTRYGHLNRILTKPGQVVEKGALIGEVGNTGRSTGPHLHYEIEQDGRRIDPTPYIHTW